VHHHDWLLIFFFFFKDAILLIPLSLEIKTHTLSTGLTKVSVNLLNTILGRNVLEVSIPTSLVFEDTILNT
jgi:hypothetical protein